MLYPSICSVDLSKYLPIFINMFCRLIKIFTNTFHCTTPNPTNRKGNTELTNPWLVGGCKWRNSEQKSSDLVTLIRTMQRTIFIKVVDFKKR